jgi:hypothetical protein
VAYFFKYCSGCQLSLLPSTFLDKSHPSPKMQRVRENKPPQQVTLFDIAPKHCDPDRIDPFKLHLQSMAFYRMPDDFGQAAIAHW